MRQMCSPRARSGLCFLTQQRTFSASSEEERCSPLQIGVMALEDRGPKVGPKPHQPCSPLQAGLLALMSTAQFAASSTAVPAAAATTLTSRDFAEATAQYALGDAAGTLAAAAAAASPDSAAAVGQSGYAMLEGTFPALALGLAAAKQHFSSDSDSGSNSSSSRIIRRRCSEYEGGSQEQPQADWGGKRPQRNACTIGTITAWQLLAEEVQQEMAGWVGSSEASEAPSSAPATPAVADDDPGVVNGVRRAAPGGAEVGAGHGQAAGGKGLAQRQEQQRWGQRGSGPSGLPSSSREASCDPATLLQLDSDRGQVFDSASETGSMPSRDGSGGRGFSGEGEEGAGGLCGDPGATNTRGTASSGGSNAAVLPAGSPFEQRYVAYEELGRGAFGCAIRAERRSDGAAVCIKVLEAGSMSKRERATTRDEVRVLSALCHPNIVAYHECFHEGGRQYIVMEFCAEGDLDRFIKERRGILLCEDEVMLKFVQICLALHNVHSKGILHRDIKTNNIFVARGGILKLGDFGIAKVMEGGQACARTLVGTPSYFSPELVQDKPYNFKSDVWALGVVLFELCTLRRPFSGQSMSAIAVKILRGTYPPLPAHFSPQLHQLVGLLLSRKADKRPNMEQILACGYVREHMRRYREHIQQYMEEHRVAHASCVDRILSVHAQQGQQGAPEHPSLGSEAGAAEQQQEAKRQQEALQAVSAGSTLVPALHAQATDLMQQGKVGRVAGASAAPAAAEGIFAAPPEVAATPSLEVGAGEAPGPPLATTAAVRSPAAKRTGIDSAFGTGSPDASPQAPKSQSQLAATQLAAVQRPEASSRARSMAARMSKSLAGTSGSSLDRSSSRGQSRLSLSGGGSAGVVLSTSRPSRASATISQGRQPKDGGNPQVQEKTLQIRSTGSPRGGVAGRGSRHSGSGSNSGGVHSPSRRESTRQVTSQSSKAGQGQRGSKGWVGAAAGAAAIGMGGIKKIATAPPRSSKPGVPSSLGSLYPRSSLDSPQSLLDNTAASSDTVLSNGSAHSSPGAGSVQLVVAGSGAGIASSKQDQDTPPPSPVVDGPQVQQGSQLLGMRLPAKSHEEAGVHGIAPASALIATREAGAPGAGPAAVLAPPAAGAKGALAKQVPALLVQMQALLAEAQVASMAPPGQQGASLHADLLAEATEGWEDRMERERADRRAAVQECFEELVARVQWLVGGEEGSRPQSQGAGAEGGTAGTEGLAV